MKSINIVWLLIIFSFQAKSVERQTLSDALSAQKFEYPFLGMDVLSIENNKHVLVSKNGRFMIKGSLEDLWKGVTHSFIDPNPVDFSQANKLSEMINKDSISVTFGNNNGTPIEVFLSYSCVQCRLFVKQILDQGFLKRFKIRIYPVYRTEMDKKVAESIFCGEDKQSLFKLRFLNRNLNNLESCDSVATTMAVTYANVFPIRSLPATVSYSKKLMYGSLPEKF